jgi:WD40 repeat protein
MRVAVISAILIGSVPHTVIAQSGDLTYWQDIRPIFRKHCTACHSARNVKKIEVSGGLALDTFDGVKKGSKRAVVEPGKSDKSLLHQLLITSDEQRRMPLETDPLANEKIELIKRWIDSGAKEGTPPAEIAVAPTKKAATRKLDVVLPTNAVLPAGSAGSKVTGKLELALKVGPLAPITALAFSPDNKFLAAGSYGQVVIWDLTKAEPARVLTNVLGAVNDARFSPKGDILAVAGGQPSAKGDLKLYQTSDWKLLATLRGHDDVVFSIAFSPDGKRLASASFDQSVRLWNVQADRREGDRREGEAPAEPGKAPDDKRLGGSLALPKNLALPTHAPLRVYHHHSDFVYAVAFSPDGKQLVSASKDRTVVLFDVETGKSVFTYSGMEQDVMAVAFHPDGKSIISSGFESNIYRWSPETGEKIGKVVTGHGIATHELAYSKDGKRFVSAGADRTVRSYDGATGAMLKVFSVGSVCYSVAISADNKRVASGSFDGLVRLWDEATGRHLATFLAIAGEGEQYDWLALTPEGYAAAGDKLTGMGRWRVSGQEANAEAVWKAVRQPQAVAQAIRGEGLQPPGFKK